MRKVVRNLVEYRFALQEIEGYLGKHGYPIELRASVAKNKRMEQLGGMFGVWIKEISDYTGDSQEDIHQELKHKFLARIYVTHPMGDEQEQWVELLAHYQETGQQQKLEKHAKRISLSWARLTQMSDYMDCVYNHYLNNGLFLSPLEKQANRRAGNV